MIQANGQAHPTQRASEDGLVLAGDEGEGLLGWGFRAREGMVTSVGAYRS